jgi:hypothetical protein
LVYAPPLYLPDQAQGTKNINRYEDEYAGFRQQD